MNSLIEIRDDDVLQVSGISKNQRIEINGKSLFWHFLEADKIFEECNYPCILAICSEGIDEYPDWVEHIKKNIHRYKIELHGSKHYNYSKFGKEDLKKELLNAIEKIEDTFKQKITTWYMPYGRKGKNEYGEEVCEELGIKYDVPIGKIDGKVWLKYYKNNKSPFDHINFHYWCSSQREKIKEVLKIIKGISP